MTITLPSNHGNAQFSITLISKSEYANESGFDSNVLLSSSHWDGDHWHPLSLKFDGLWLRRNDMIALHTYLASWVSQPLASLATSVLLAEFQLARLPGQSLKLIFGPREDTIDERKPVVTVELKANSFRTDFHFVTDQSCLAIFAQHLSKV